MHSPTNRISKSDVFIVKTNFTIGYLNSKAGLRWCLCWRMGGRQPKKNVAMTHALKLKATLGHTLNWELKHRSVLRSVRIGSQSASEDTNTTKHNKKKTRNSTRKRRLTDTVNSTRRPLARSPGANIECGNLE